MLAAPTSNFALVDHVHTSCHTHLGEWSKEYGLSNDTGISTVL